MTNSTDQLLPCPFCGDPNPNLTHDDYVHDDLRPMPVVECTKCHTWVRAEAWNRRAQLPAGGAVPEGYALAPRALIERIASDDEGLASLADFEELRAMLAAAPHPVSGEQKSVRRAPDTCNGNRCGWCNEGAEACKYSPVQRQFRDDEQRAWSALIEQPVAIAAQDVAGLVEALEPFADFIAGTDPVWSDDRRISTLDYDFTKLRLGLFRKAAAALAAQRAQQGDK